MTKSYSITIFKTQAILAEFTLVPWANIINFSVANVFGDKIEQCILDTNAGKQLS
jgi:hypothetical protein